MNFLLIVYFYQLTNWFLFYIISTHFIFSFSILFYFCHFFYQVLLLWLFCSTHYIYENTAYFEVWKFWFLNDNWSFRLSLAEFIFFHFQNQSQ